MSILNIPLSDALQAFVDHQIAEGGHTTASEYVRELIRKDQDRSWLRDLLLDGAVSEGGPLADDVYFDGLRESIRG